MARRWKIKEEYGERLELGRLPRTGFAVYMRGWFITWEDGSQCFQIDKWVETEEGLRLFYPMQRIQIPLSYACEWMMLFGGDE